MITPGSWPPAPRHGRSRHRYTERQGASTPRGCWVRKSPRSASFALTTSRPRAGRNWMPIWHASARSGTKRNGFFVGNGYSSRWRRSSARRRLKAWTCFIAVYLLKVPGRGATRGLPATATWAGAKPASDLQIRRICFKVFASGCSSKRKWWHLWFIIIRIYLYMYCLVNM